MLCVLIYTQSHVTITNSNIRTFSNQQETSYSIYAIMPMGPYKVLKEGNGSRIKAKMVCYWLNICVPFNSYFEILTSGGGKVFDR